MLRRGLLACSIALLALPVAQASALNAPGSFWGLNYAYYNDLTPKELFRLQKAKLKTMRMTITWSTVEARRGTYNWNVPDRIIGALASKGIQARPILYGTPLWATGRTFAGLPLDGQSINIAPVQTPEQEEHWKDFLAAVVDRYSPGGAFWTQDYPDQHPGKPVLPIRGWQIWNEPNIPGAYKPQPDYQQYAHLVEISHDAIVAADAGAKIILGGIPGRVTYPGWNFLAQLYSVPNFKDYFDEVAIHPYSDSVALVRNAVTRFHDVMKNNDDLATPLWISEFSWGSNTPDGHLNVGPGGQAYLMLKSFKMFAKNRQKWNLDSVSWFNFRDPPTGAQNPNCPWCAYAGLFDPNDNPKPAWDIFQHFTAGKKIPHN